MVHAVSATVLVSSLVVCMPANTTDAIAEDAYGGTTQCQAAVITQAEAEAIATTSGVQKPAALATRHGLGINRREFLALYQVCPHLGCLVPYIASEKRFICPCHGSTYERNSQYVRGPAPRSMDQFRVMVANDTAVVNTGQRVFGQVHA
jgi:Rieske Fe-S protein